VADPVPADFEAIEGAFFDWVMAATGLDDSVIVWANQGVLRPANIAFASLDVTAIDAPGLPAQSHSYDPAAPLNQELTHVASGPRVGTLRAQFYAGAATGNVSSRALAARALAGLWLPGRQEAFRAVGVGILDAGPVRDISGVLELQIEPRAQLDVRFTFMDLAFERGGYIATAPVTVVVEP
jgi:hypothetical protein